MTNLKALSIEDEMKGDVYSYALILWEMMSRKAPWAHCIIYFSLIFFLKKSFSSLFQILIPNKK